MNKKNKPKILVATLKVSENEFSECKKVIENQNYEDFDHFVIEGLPNKEAHQALFQEFLNESDEYDLLVKVDADTVLRDQDCLQRIANDFSDNSEINLIQYALHDFFTGKPMYGLNCYRGNFIVRDQDDLYVDRFIEITSRIRIEDVIADHSPNPSEYQAFHFGFHRQLKNQYRVIFDVLLAYLKSFNRKRELVLAGAMSVRKGDLGIENNRTYHDSEIKKSLKQALQKKRVHLFMSLIWSHFFTLPRYAWQFLKKMYRKLNS